MTPVIHILFAAGPVWTSVLAVAGSALILIGGLWWETRQIEQEIRADHARSLHALADAHARARREIAELEALWTLDWQDAA